MQIIHIVTGEVLLEVEGANLRDANLRGADLRDANLRDVDLGGANLRDANLRDVDLGGANLRGADLGGADLRDANLRGADLRGADLRDANLGGAEGVVTFRAGEYNRLCVAIYHKDGTMFKLGCHYGNLESSLQAIQSKYGLDSNYAKLCMIYDDMLKNNKK